MLKKSDEIWTLELYREFHGLNHGRDSYSDRNFQKPLKNHQNHGSVHFHGLGTPRQTVIFKNFAGHYISHILHKLNQISPIPRPRYRKPAASPNSSFSNRFQRFFALNCSKSNHEQDPSNKSCGNRSTNTHFGFFNPKKMLFLSSRFSRIWFVFVRNFRKN